MAVISTLFEMGGHVSENGGAPMNSSLKQNTFVGEERAGEV